jgi:hypothetical protein
MTALPDDGDSLPKANPDAPPDNLTLIGQAGSGPAPVPTRWSRPPLPYHLEVGRTIARSFSIWMKSFVPFSILSVIVNLPVIVLTYAFLANEPSDLMLRDLNRATHVLDFLAGSVLSGAVTFSVIQHLRGRPAGIGPSLATGLHSLLVVLGVSLVVGLMTLVGLVLFIIPGIIVSCTFNAAVPAAVIEKIPVGAALRRSKNLTIGNRWSIFGAFFGVGLFALVVNVIIRIAVVGTEPAATWQDAAINTAMGQILAALFTPVLAVIPSVIYHDLRIGKEGANVEDLAAVFD